MSWCEICDGSGWIVDERGASPCECRKQLHPRKPFPDDGGRIDKDNAGFYVWTLCETLAFAPSGDLGRTKIVEFLLGTCETAAEAKWTVDRALELYRKWDDCGLPGLRQIISSFRIPKDGYAVFSTSVYPDGLPPASPQLLESRALPSGETASSLQLAVSPGRSLYPKGWPRGPLSPEERRREIAFNKLLEEVITPPEDRPKLPALRKQPQAQIQSANENQPDTLPRNPEPLPEGSFRRITQADVDEVLRNKPR